jgi:rod shape-determining protein MreC
MKFFFKFFAKHSPFFAFILLEAISILMIANKSVFQKSFLTKLSMESTAFLHSKINGIDGYFRLKSINEQLSEKNAYLMERIDCLENIIENDSLSKNMPDASLMSYIPAKIVNKSIDRINNYFIIDKGSQDGVKDEMGVISNNGVMGVVKTTSDNYSIVLSILSDKLKISGKIQNSNYLCTIVWDGYSPFTGKVFNIPEHIRAKIGDKIVTSGYSAIFPENIEIGTIEKITLNPTTAWNDYKIKYVTDFMSVNYVYVINFKHQAELNAIEKMAAEIQ